MRFKVVIFDLDGTLVDSYPAIHESLNHTRIAFGLPTYDVATVKTMVGRGLENLMRQAVGDERLKDGIAIFRRSYDETHLRGTLVLPGVRQTLEELHHLGVKMAIATNKPSDYSRNILRHLQLDAFFKECYGPDRCGGRAKPDPAMLNAVMIALQTTPRESLYVGDMMLDAESAHNAGVSLALVATGGNTYTELESIQPDYLFPDITGILALFE